MVKISSSILSADFAKLGDEIQALEAAGTDMIHIDVMDGHFVPNLTIGPQVIKNLRKYTKLPFDIHLMVEKPERYINDYVDAGADIITIHPEATIHLDKLLTQIQSHGIKSGVAFLPSTPEQTVKYMLDKIDLLLVMSVNPGFAGQTFITTQLIKINLLARMLKEYDKNIMLAVDGGINASTAQKAIRAGANVLVAGSFIFGHQSYAQAIRTLRN